MAFTSHEQSRGLRRPIVVALAGLTLFLLALTPVASADLQVGSSGPGAEQYEDPRGVAVDATTGRVYVTDRGHNRVVVFEAGGSFVKSFGSKGSGQGQFEGPTGVAVDNDPGSPTFHDVYVVDAGNNRVQRFDPAGEFLLMVGDGVNATSGGDVCPRPGFPADVCGKGTGGGGAGQLSDHVQVAVGPGGVVYVADSTPLGGDIYEERVQEFDSSGALIKTVPLSIAGKGFFVGIAVDSGGDVYAATNFEPGAVRKFDPAGNLLVTIDHSLNIQAIALDGAGDLFVADATAVFPDDGSIGAETAIYEYDSSGAPVRTFYGNGTLVNRAISLAPYSNAGGDIFLVEGSSFEHPSRVVQVAFPPPGPVIPSDAKLLKAGPVGNVRATLHAFVNPEGKESEVRFEYVDDTSFQSEGGFSSPHTRTSASSAKTPADFKLHEVSAQILCDSSTPEADGCLKPETLYHFRAVGENDDSPLGGIRSVESTFTTLAPLELGDSWSTDVGTDTAVLHTALNPLSLPYSGYFEYVDEAEFQASGFTNPHKVPDVDGGAGAISFGPGESQVARSAPLTGLVPDTTYHYRLIATNPFFGTFTGVARELRTFAASEVPPSCGNDAFRSGASAALSDCRSYEMVSPVDKDNGDIVSPPTGENSNPGSYFQSAAGGNRISYSSARAFANPQGAPYVSQYLGDRGGGGWASRSISPPRQTNVNSGNEVESLYNQFKVFSADLSSAWLWQYADPPLGDPPGVTGFRNLYRRDNEADTYEALSGVEPQTSSAENYKLILQGISGDGSTVVYTANDALNAKAAPCSKKPCAYQLYEYTGNAKKPQLVSVLPTNTASVADNVAGGGGPISGTNFFVPYYNENVAHAVSEDGSRIYWTASSGGGTGQIYLRVGGKETLDVSKLIATDPALFWGADPAGGKAIFSFVAGPKAGNLYEYDLGSKTSSLIAEGVEGVAGASEDLARIYLVSSKALDGAAQAGGRNLYLYEGGSFTFIAALSAGVGGLQLGYDNVADRSPFRRSARVSADGGEIAFTSTGRLTGYDNADAVNGNAATEVYRYDAAAKKLLCVSCNPSGSRPEGRFSPLRYEQRYGPPAQVASQIPGWEDSLYVARVLSADGQRLFFESYDALLPRDTNGTNDVYQWEAVGKGDCTTARADYFESNGGCVSLISSGTSAGESEFADASESGDDVFFTTESSLVSQDPGLIDVYDARVGGGFPPPVAQPAACEGEACQPPPEAPNDPTPASASFEGAGNVHEEAKPRCAKGKVRRKGRCVAKRHRRAKRHRANHERRAGR